MRFSICAIGRARGGPEAELTSDYLSRLDKAGRALGLGPARLLQLVDKRGGGPQAEAQVLREAVPEGAFVVALDERGQMLTSPGLAQAIASARDAGRRDMALLIGGADGLDPALRDRADLVLSLGRMVWPYMLVRAMLAEQLYRAVSILSGSPYHRD